MVENVDSNHETGIDLGNRYRTGQATGEKLADRGTTLGLARGAASHLEIYMQLLAKAMDPNPMEGDMDTLDSLIPSEMLYNRPLNPGDARTLLSPHDITPNEGSITQRNLSSTRPTPGDLAEPYGSRYISPYSAPYSPDDETDPDASLLYETTSQKADDDKLYLPRAPTKAIAGYLIDEAQIKKIEEN